MSKEASYYGMGQCCAELDIDVRWAGEPDVLLKLEPSNKWLMNAVKIGVLLPRHVTLCSGSLLSSTEA